MLSNYYTLGNADLIKEHKIVFLCSQKCPAHIVLKSYDWAIAQREKSNCVISGFHSKIEQDVLHFLIKGNQSIILALARGLKKIYEQFIQNALSEKRLLIVTPFEESTNRVTAETAKQRNQFMCELADEIFVAYASSNGKLLSLVENYITKGKTVTSFYVPENEHLFKLRVKRFTL